MRSVLQSLFEMATSFNIQLNLGILTNDQYILFGSCLARSWKIRCKKLQLFVPILPCIVIHIDHSLWGCLRVREDQFNPGSFEKNLFTYFDCMSEKNQLTKNELKTFSEEFASLSPLLLSVCKRWWNFLFWYWLNDWSTKEDVTVFLSRQSIIVKHKRRRHLYSMSTRC